MISSVARVLRRSFAPLTAAVLFAALVAGAAVAMSGDTPTLRPGAKPLPVSEESEQELLARDFFFMSRRTAGDVPLSTQQAGAQRALAAHEANSLRRQG